MFLRGAICCTDLPSVQHVLFLIYFCKLTKYVLEDISYDFFNVNVPFVLVKILSFFLLP